MSTRERLTPLLAAGGALSTLLCCLPIAFAGAVGLGSASAVATKYRLWLIGGSVALLVVGFIQVYRPGAQCVRRSRLNMATLWLSLLLVAVVFLMPQLVASLLADWL